MEFNNYKIKNASSEFADLCDFILNQHQMVTVAFAAVCSNVFKDEISRVYESSDKNLQLQKQDEALFEQARKEAGSNRKNGGLGLDIKNLKEKIFASQQFTPGTFNVGFEDSKGAPGSEEKPKVQSETREEFVEFQTGDKKVSKLPSMYSLDYIFTKKDFKRIVKWCEEDSSNIWYDHME